MGNVYYGVHEKIAEMLADRHGLKTFVETGTWHGDSAKWAASRFEQVITIEVIEEYFIEARQRFLGDKNVLCVYGDSRELLLHITRTLDKPVLFWLDAHWTGHKEFSSKKYGVCAVREEMKVINKSTMRNVIMIDDARLFPSMTGIEPDEVVRLLSNNGMRSVTIEDDIFYAEPIERRASDKI